MEEAGEASQIYDTAGQQIVSFVVDSGPSKFAFPSSKYMFNYYVECDRTVSTAAGNSFPVLRYGDIRVELLSAGRVVRVVIENVAHVPTFQHNLLLVGARDTPFYSKMMYVPISSNQEHRCASLTSGACSLAKITRCRPSKPPLLSSLGAYAHHVACRH